jgi:hypothetical protein
MCDYWIFSFIKNQEDQVIEYLKNYLQIFINYINISKKHKFIKLCSNTGNTSIKV